MLTLATGLTRKRAAVILAAALLSLLAVATLYMWQNQRSRSLLPSTISSQITNFDVYFFSGSVPAGYSIDTALTRYENGVLMVRLYKSGSPSITLTEQAMPSKLTHKDVQQNGTPVRDTAGTSTINSAEGRLIGTLISPDQKTLVLLNCPGEANKADITLLLQGLRKK